MTTSVTEWQGDSPGDATTDEATLRSIEAVQSAARTLVDELRRTNQPPEKMLIEIKRILADAGFDPTFPITGEGEGMEVPRSSVYRQIIEWSIRYYFEAP